MQLLLVSVVLGSLLVGQISSVLAAQIAGHSPISSPISTPISSPISTPTPTSLPILKPNSKADLIPTNHLRAPFTAKPGQTISVRWTVTNQGNQEAVHTPTTSAWEDRVYLSADPNYDGTDIYMGKFKQTAALTAGSSYTATSDLYVPYKAPSGLYYLILRVDNWNDVSESNNNNNQKVRPIYISK